MLIILEGPDGSGKTTFANDFIKENKDFRYHHEGPTPDVDDVLDYYCSVIDNVKNQHTVIDRCALGECVYGPAVRGIDKLGKDGWAKFQLFLSSVSTPISQLVFLPPYDVCYRNWYKTIKDQLYKKHMHFVETYARFAWFAHYDNRLQVFDYTRHNYVFRVQDE